MAPEQDNDVTAPDAGMMVVDPPKVDARAPALGQDAGTTTTEPDANAAAEVAALPEEDAAVVVEAAPLPGIDGGRQVDGAAAIDAAKTDAAKTDAKTDNAPAQDAATTLDAGPGGCTIPVVTNPCIGPDCPAPVYVDKTCLAYGLGKTTCTSAGQCVACSQDNIYDCNGDNRDGCETVVSDQHCGRCDVACVGSMHCVDDGFGGVAYYHCAVP